MHDPLSVAWEIRFPLPWKERKTFRTKDGKRHPRQFHGGRRWSYITLCTIWHRDPETDGSDDSCSVSKRLTKDQHDVLKFSGGDEARNPWFRRERAREPQSPADAERLLRGALWYVTQILRLDRRCLGHKRLTFDHCERRASELLHNPLDNVRGSLCLLPGWHTSEPSPSGEYQDEIDVEDDAAWKRERIRSHDSYPADTSEWKRRDLGEQFFGMCGRILSRDAARWWQHPRWHVWHWRFQVPLWQRFYRRWFERCGACRARFRGGNVFSDYHGTRRWCEECNR